MAEVAKSAQSAKDELDTNADMLVFSEDDNIDDMYLTFGVDVEDYGVGIVYVTEIVGMQKIMEVPDVPYFIKGVINLRGKVIPVMDVRSRFNMKSSSYNERTVIIVLDVDKVSVGLIVDRVSDVLEIGPADIDPPPKFGKHKETNSVIKGMGKKSDKVAILLDVGALLSDQELHIDAIRAGIATMQDSN